MCASNRCILFNFNIPFVAALLIVFMPGCGTMPPNKTAVDTVKQTPIWQSPSESSICNKPDQARHTHWDVLSQPGSRGLVAAPGTEAHLDRIAQRLLSGFGITAPGVGIYLLPYDGYNAATYSDCAIYLNWGLIEKATSDDELAAVMAHELAHLILKHHDSDRIWQALGWASRAAMLAFAMSGPVVGNTIQVGPAQVSRALSAGSVDNFSVELLGPSWTRQQEREADMLAVDLLVAAGYSPVGMLQVLAKIPDSAAREKNLGWWILELGVGLASGQSSESASQAVTLLAVLANAVAQPALAQAEQTHPVGSERTEDAKQYTVQKYERETTRRTSNASLKELRKQREYVQLSGELRWVLPRIAGTATTRLGHLGADRSLALSGEAGYPGEHTAKTSVAVSRGASRLHPATYLGKTFAVQAGLAGSDGYLSLLRDKSTPVEYKLATAAFLLRQSQPQMALNLIADLESQFGEQDVFYPLKVRAMMENGNDIQAMFLTNKCQIEIILKLDFDEIQKTQTKKSICDPYTF